MVELRIGDQLIRFDREATIAAYSAIGQGDADGCGCQGCRNFAIQRNEAYPQQFRDLLNTVGIDLTKEGEAVCQKMEGISIAADFTSSAK